MAGKVKKAMLILWQIGLPLLIYVAAAELVFGVWNALLGLAGQEQYLPLTAAAAAMVSVPLGLEYKRWKSQAGEKAQMSVGSAVCAMVFGVASCLFFNGLIMFLPLQKEGYRQVSQVLYRPSLLVQLVCMGAVIPLGEELVFRGLGYGRIRRKLPFWGAAAVSAAWFGLYHGNLAQGIYAALLGIFLAWFYEKSKSLLSCWLFHGMANVTSVIMTGFFQEEPGQTIGQGAAMMAAGVLIFGGFCAALRIKKGEHVRRTKIKVLRQEGTEKRI